MTFGQWVKLKRQQEGRSQWDLSLEVGISQSVITRLEQGKSSISLYLAECLAHCFGYRLSDALKEVEKSLKIENKNYYPPNKPSLIGE
jgi:ribosome-binding protein aMBF1 (putative translation factor)